MADGGRVFRGSRGPADRDEPPDEVDSLRPFIELAREIKREVERIAADDHADIDQLSAAIDQFPRAERQRVALAVFDRLPPDVQWAVLERVFGDEDIRGYLEDEHRRRAERLGQGGARLVLAEDARAGRALDTRRLAVGDQITVGLFREPDVRAAVTRGHVSDSCARSVVLRAEEPELGRLRVIDDVFNPRGGYFVTRDYDATTWVVDRFASHDRIRIGAAGDGPEGPSFEPVLYLGGRVDFEHDGAITRGHLHMGFVMLDDIDVFAGQG